jgi:hypothetical protein
MTLVDSGFSVYKGKYDSGYSLSWGVIVKNPNANAVADDVRLVVDFLDASGTLVTTSNDSWPAILPNQTVALGEEISYFSNSDLKTVAKMEVQVFHGDDWEDFDGSAGEFSFSDIKTRADSIGSLDTTARISSTFAKDLQSPYAVAIYRREGAIVGAGWTFVDLVPAGGQVGVEIYGPSIPKVDSTEMYAHFSNLTIFGN